MTDPRAPLFAQDPTGRFSDRAADYAAARPSYPAAAVSWLLEGLGDLGALAAADVGAGTGISARLLADRGVDVAAVEPNAAMRAAALPHPRVRFLAGTAEATTLADASVGLVVCAQAFHWFDTTRALPELARILRPGGRLAVLWNERDREHDPATAEYSRLTREASAGHAADAHYADPAPALVGGGFGHLERRGFPSTQALTRDGLLRRAFSASYVPKEGPRAEALTAGLKALFVRDQQGGQVTLRYETIVVLAARPPVARVPRGA